MWGASRCLNGKHRDPAATQSILLDRGHQWLPCTTWIPVPVDPIFFDAFHWSFLWWLQFSHRVFKCLQQLRSCCPFDAFDCAGHWWRAPHRQHTCCGIGQPLIWMLAEWVYGRTKSHAISHVEIPTHQIYHDRLIKNWMNNILMWWELVRDVGPNSIWSSVPSCIKSKFTFLRYSGLSHGLIFLSQPSFGACHSTSASVPSGRMHVEAGDYWDSSQMSIGTTKWTVFVCICF